MIGYKRASFEALYFLNKFDIVGNTHARIAPSYLSAAEAGQIAG
jgi:hypothetical protein